MLLKLIVQLRLLHLNAHCKLVCEHNQSKYLFVEVIFLDLLFIKFIIFQVTQTGCFALPGLQMAQNWHQHANKAESCYGTPYLGTRLVKQCWDTSNGSLLLLGNLTSGSFKQLFGYLEHGMPFWYISTSTERG